MIGGDQSVALFGKKNIDNGSDNGDGSNGDGPVEHGGDHPEKAKAFFDHARTAHDTLNYAYAVQCWLNGLAQDPGDYDGFQGFFQSVQTLVAEQGKKANKSEIAKGLNGKGPIGKYQDALLNWGFKPGDGSLSLKAAEAAGALGVQRVTNDLGKIALQQARGKPKKDNFVRLMEAFEKAGSYPLAVEAGEEAIKLDRSDGELQRRVQQLAAQSTISSGGYDDTGKEGGFRKNIRDADKQAMLEAQDSLSKTEDVKDRLVKDAEAAFSERPNDLPTLERYCKALLERGKNADELKAMTIYTNAHKETGQFRFRERSGEIILSRMRRTVASLEAKSKAAPDDAAVAEKLASARKQFSEKQIEELRLQVENYPTDLRRKFQLGLTLASRGEHQNAIEYFQMAQDDPKIRPQVLYAMGQSFLELDGWEDAAIDTFRQALSGVVDDGSDMALELRYGLMCALQAKGEADSDLDASEEADRLAGAIAMKKFNYKDIQERRKAIKAKIAELRG
ncbi:MAG: hypothetical protein CMJ31_03575 [Phycisphaerae bacterium]|nr:hypothetical protein [Phycisphaerae bacterium]